jgi:hypothetical protein
VATARRRTRRRSRCRRRAGRGRARASSPAPGRGSAGTHRRPPRRCPSARNRPGAFFWPQPLILFTKLISPSFFGC